MLKETNQTTINLSNYSSLYNILIVKNNFWRQLNEMLDFSFVFEELKEKYSSTMGRKAEEVVRMFKYLLLKGYYKLSDRGLVERTKTDLLFKYFLGYSPEETELIDPSLLTVFRRERLSNKENEEETSTNLLDKLIGKTVELALEEGLIEAKNAELKSNFGYDEANATGKVGITIQGATTLFLANMKRIIKLKEEKSIENE